MAGNIQIPRDVTRTLDVKVTDNSEVLRKFLTEQANKLLTLEETVAALELRVAALE